MTHHRPGSLRAGPGRRRRRRTQRPDLAGQRPDGTVARPVQLPARQARSRTSWSTRRRARLDAAEQQQSDDEDALDAGARRSWPPLRRPATRRRSPSCRAPSPSCRPHSPPTRPPIDTARARLTQAKQTRDKTLLADRQAIQTQQGQVYTAEDALTTQQAQRAANQQPAREGAVDSAQAQIDNAQVAVDKAEQAVERHHRPGAGGRHRRRRRRRRRAVRSRPAAVPGPPRARARAVRRHGGEARPAAGQRGAGPAVRAWSPWSTTGQAGDGGRGRSRHRQGASTGQSAWRWPSPRRARTVKGKVTSVATESTVSEQRRPVRRRRLPAGRRLLDPARSDRQRHHHHRLAHRTCCTSRPARSPPAARPSSVTRRVGDIDSIVQVQTGLVGANGTEIVRGLAEGDQVVLPTGDRTGGFTFPGAAFRRSGRLDTEQHRRAHGEPARGGHAGHRPAQHHQDVRRGGDHRPRRRRGEPGRSTAATTSRSWAPPAPASPR